MKTTVLDKKQADSSLQQPQQTALFTPKIDNNDR